MGKDLIRFCNDRRLLIDLSHLNEKGFWDAATLSKAPLVATHSNAQAICASSRNLSDDQLKAVRDSGGMVGLNFASGFLREDGRWSTDTPLEIMVRHLDHMLKVAGENCVALGSDFDGARIPDGIKDATGLPNLIEALRERLTRISPMFISTSEVNTRARRSASTTPIRAALISTPASARI